MSDNNNKDPIERLFREKAGKYDISYREADWLKLEKRLEEQEQRSASLKRGWFIAAAVLLVIALLGYAVYQNHQQINRLYKELEDQQITETPPKTPPGGDSPNDQLQSDKNSSQRKEETEVPASSDNTRSPSSSSQQAPLAGLIGERTADELPCSPCQLSSLEQYAGSEKEVRAELTAVRGPARPPVSVAGENDTDASAGPRRSPPSPGRASAGILLGPDLSTVGSLSDFRRPGYNLGIALEYRLSPALSIRTGLVRSSVRYTADGSEYNPPGGFWSYDVVPDRTTAACVILDIPLSLIYNVHDFGHSRLYASAGINSYVMLNEEYQFKYASPDEHLVQGWSGRTGTSHWFSNANISIGYEYDLNARLSLRVEPFLKLPVRTVGWGNVKLYSVGSFVSFNYNLNPNHSRE